MLPIEIWYPNGHLEMFRRLPPASEHPRCLAVCLDRYPRYYVSEPSLWGWRWRAVPCCYALQMLDQRIDR
jgi:hypothetical protein